jgi:hypothetical protein
MRHSYFPLLVTLGLVICISEAQADLINSFDSPSDVTLSAGQAPGTWYIDRAAPAGFASGQPGGGRTGTLLESISGGDYTSPANFYDTQGRKFDLATGTTSLFIDLYVPNSWGALNQSNTPAEAGRIAGFWATGVDGSANVSSYPIIEFNNQGGGGFQIFDSVTTGQFSNVSGFSGYDKWYQLGFSISGGQEHFYVNGAQVGTIADSDTVQLANVILQGINGGNSFDISWDNLQTSVPEPSTFVVWSLLGLTSGAVWRRRRNRSA